MANVLGTYDPTIFAQEALIQLENALGMAARVHRGFSKGAQAKGSTIDIRRPGDFTAANAPASATDLATETVTINLDQWREVKASLSDKELTATGEIIITEHLRRMAYVLADDIDVKLNSLYADVPWFHDYSGTPVVGDITSPRKILFENGVPMEAGMLHLEVNGTVEAALLGLSAFTQWQGAGAAGADSQMRGTLGTRFGLEVFANQNVASHTKGTADDAALAVDGAGFLAGDTTINLKAAGTGTIVPGDVFSIAGNTQQYAVTNTTTASGNAHTGVTFTPGLAAAPSDSDVVTLYLDNHGANLAFHHDAFALAMAPLSDLGNQLGARMATVVNEKTGIALRTRLFYIGDTSKVYLAVDVLYGKKTLNPNMAVRLRS